MDAKDPGDLSIIPVNHKGERRVLQNCLLIMYIMYAHVCAHAHTHTHKPGKARLQSEQVPLELEG